MNKVVKVTPLVDRLLELVFANGTVKIVDIKPFIGKGVSSPLREDDYFKQVDIDSAGGIYWPNGYDFCPNYLYEELPAIEAIELEKA